MEKVDPRVIAISMTVAERILFDGPQAIIAIAEAWKKVDPTAEDFEKLVGVMEGMRPKDPLKKS